MQVRLPLALLAVLVSFAPCAGDDRLRGEPTPASEGGAVFVPNLGQWPDSVRFGLRASSATVALEDRGLVLGLFDGSTALGVRMSFDGAAPSPHLAAEGVRPGHHDYFFGNDPSRWRTGVPLYSAVHYGGLYPGIDLRMRVAGGHPEYDLMLDPGADLARVCVRVEGAAGLLLQDDGSLLLETALGPVRQPVPRTWQGGDTGERREVSCRYVLRGRDRFGFEVDGWDGDAALTIDPGLIWRQSLGTTTQYAVSLDGGVVTAAGTAQSLVTTAGAYSVTGSSFLDAFVTRMVPANGGAQLLYSTYLGGSGPSTSGDEARDVHVDAAGVVTVVGWTNSADFPTTPGAYSTTYAGGSTDAFVARLDPSRTGAAQLVYSTFLGGRGGNPNWDERCEALSVDQNGVMTVGGSTSAPDFPTTPNAFSRTFQSHSSTWDGFISRLDPSRTGAAQLVYSTLFGGWSQYVNTGDYVMDLQCDGSGVITFCGGTESTMGFPVTPGAYDTTPGRKAFLSRLDPSRTGNAQLLYSTFFGGGTTFAEALSVAPDDVVTLAGYGFVPTTPGAYDRTPNGGFDAFASQLDLAKTGAAQLVYSTLLGGSAGGEGDKAWDLAVDGPLITLVGRTNSPDFPTTPGAYDPTRNSPGNDGFLSRLDLTLTGSRQLVYSTFIDFEYQTWAVATGMTGRAVVGGYGDVGELELAPYLGGPGSQDPDIAYDRSSRRYLVAWAEGGGNGPLAASLVDDEGNAVGSALAVGAGREPSVANVRGRSRFAVGAVAQDGQSLAFRSVDPASGAVSSPAVLQVSGPGEWSGLELAGDVTTSGDGALAVWEQFDPGAGLGTVLGARVTIAASGAVSVSPPQTLRVGASRPALSRTGGATGRYLVVWTEAGQLTATVIDTGFNALGQVVVAAAPPSSDPVAGVDGDGTNWVVAYEQARSGGTGFELRSRRVTYATTSGRAVLGPEAIVNEGGGSAPAVAFVGGSQWVVYQVSSASSARITSIDPHGCTACEGTLSLGFAGLPGVAVGSQRTGDPAAGDHGLVAWAEGSAGRTRLKLRLMVADDGTIQDLGGGCGPGGEALATCAITGHADFEHWLQGAAPSASALLVISTRTAGFPCGPCSVVPDPAFGVTVPALTDADGAAATPMPIPALASLVGTVLIDQWFVLAPGGCFLGVSFSNAIGIEIE